MLLKSVCDDGFQKFLGDGGNNEKQEAFPKIMQPVAFARALHYH